MFLNSLRCIGIIDFMVQGIRKCRFFFFSIGLFNNAKQLLSVVMLNTICVPVKLDLEASQPSVCKDVIPAEICVCL